MSSLEKDALTHLAPDGRARMVAVGEKPETERVAVAEGRLRVSAAAFEALSAGRTKKGDPLLVAQIAGIQAGKRTAELIPLCHPLALSQIDVEVGADSALPGVHARATVGVTGRTGVEMEALTAVSIALLTVYDMLKAVDRHMSIEDVRVVSKAGGRSGSWTAPLGTSEEERPSE
jgi:cyclic pyranopterin monophosphate synthase